MPLQAQERMGLTIDAKAAWLERQYAAAVAAATTLLVRLQSLRNERFDAVATGQVVASTSANGIDVAFSDAENAGFTPAETIELIAWALRRYSLSASMLGGAPSDAQIYAHMLEHIEDPIRRGARSIRTEFSSLRTN